ncbi:metallophosphoesterase [Sporosarcina sp. CAU 1771]
MDDKFVNKDWIGYMFKRKIIYIAVGFTVFLYFIYVQNNSIVTSHTVIRSEKLPANFDQYKIVHLSDLHNKSFGKGQQVLVRKVNKLQPDIIVFTGDLIDSKRSGDEASLLLMKKLTATAPVYYVPGNNEWWSGSYGSLEKKLEQLGVQVLRNSSIALEKEGDKVYIVGIDDPTYGDKDMSELEIIEEEIRSASEGLGEDDFTLLLSHRPEMLPLYAASNFDVVFSGHAHGGQVRLPFVGGLVAPNQGLFPKYTEGKHEMDNTVMMISRGLGNSIIPVRLFNRPEIVSVTLEQGDH